MDHERRYTLDFLGIRSEEGSTVARVSVHWGLLHGDSSGVGIVKVFCTSSGF